MSRIVLTLATLGAVSAPVVAAGLPACCLPPAGSTALRAACCAMKGAPCCKAPEAPKPEGAVKHAASAIAASAPAAGTAPVAIVAALPKLESVRVARLDHRAPSPDDSPPDRLARLHVLLI